MSNFIGMVFASLKNEGIDTSGMSTKEAVKKYNELQTKTGGKAGADQPTPAENRKTLFTKEQKEFFKDSKAVDENGLPVKLYHGTKTKGFREFKYDKNIQTGQDFGEAYYFTTNLKNAKGYAKDNSKDKRIQEYFKEKDNLIKKLLISTNENEKLKIKDEIKNLKIENKNLQELMADTDYDTGGEVKEVYLNMKNPLNVDAGNKYFYENYEEYFKQAKNEKRDGIIIKNVKDNSSANTGEPSDVYIVFKPNQIKDVNNSNPSLSNDIYE